MFKQQEILKNINLKKLYLPSFLIIYFLSLFGQYFFYALEIETGNVSLFFKIFTAISESSFWMIFVCLIKAKYRIIYLIIPFVLSIILFANILYFRNFHDLIPPSSYFHSQILNEAVLKGAYTSLKIKDLILIILPFLPLSFSLLRKDKKSYNSKRRYSFLFLGLFIFSYGITWAGAYRRISIYNNTKKFSEIIENLYPKETTNWKFFYEQHTFHGYFIKCLFSGSGKKMTLNNDDLNLIRNHLNRKDLSPNIVEKEGDSLNLIMIIVESMPMKVLSLPNLSEISPTIYQLINDSSTIVTSAKVLIEKGRSSDAQFIFNTGLLPLREEPLVTNYSTKSFPSIAKALNYNSLEIIGEDKSLWSHGTTTLAYGYDDLISNIASKVRNQDSLIFKTASEWTKKLQEPFFLFITTISMHDPYTDKKVSTTFNFKDMDSRDLEYFNRLNHFDRSLHNFLENLKIDGKFDNSVIFIIGDHDINRTQVSETLYDEFVPFLIINSPIKIAEKNREVSQLDVFPTMIDIFKPNYFFLNQPYKGLGKSIFSKDSITSIIPTEEDYRISEMIIKSDKDLQ